jgi:hypothetical protein
MRSDTDAPRSPDPHPAWLARCRELRAMLDAAGPDEATALLSAELWRHEDLLHETLARTPAGLAAQAAQLVDAVDTDSWDEHEEGGLRVLLAGLERLAREAEGPPERPG